jgi:hypothetical protein
VASVDVPSDRVRWAAAVRNLDLLAGDYHVHVELLDAQGHELGWNQFAFIVEPPQAEAEEE